MNFTMTVEGSLEVRRLLQQLGEQAPLALRSAINEEANGLLNDSDKLVPIDTRQLAQSKFQREVPDGVEVGYGGSAAPYAVKVHENPRSGHTEGVSPSGRRYSHWAAVGEWKYLETPYKARLSGFYDRIATFLRARLLKGG